MPNIIKFLFVAFFTGSLATSAYAKAVQKPGEYLSMKSPAGMERLQNSKHKADYWVLSAHFATQVTQTLCSVATAATILNSLDVKRPIDPVYDPYPYFTQTNFFNDAVNKIRTRDVTLTEGMTLQMSAKTMRIHGADAEAFHAEDVTLDEFRKATIENLKTPGNYVVVNYQRLNIGQPRGAHFSPIGAYHEASDTFLIMDVARYKFPPVWVRAEDLFAAMNTQDTEVPKSRGYIIIKGAKPDTEKS